MPWTVALQKPSCTLQCLCTLHSLPQAWSSVPAGHASLPVPWTVTLQNPQFLNASAPFNLDPTLQLSDGAVTGSATNTWQTLLAGGANSMTFGLTVEYQSNDTQPYYVLLNGEPFADDPQPHCGPAAW